MNVNKSIDEHAVEQLGSLSKRINELDQQGGSSKGRIAAPKTTLEIQGDAASEDAWQRYLRYFLDSDKPHGMGGTFTSHLVNSLQNFEIIDPELTPNYDDIVVKREVQGNSSRPDLLIYEPDKWFVCFELKVHHQERPGQTEEHVQSQQLGRLEKETIPKNHHYYLYVAPPWAGNGEATAFQALHWVRDDKGPSVVNIVSDTLESIKEEAPQRTVSQLQEFRDTINRVINMTTIDEHTRELKELYLQHKTDIDRVQEAKEDYTEWFFETKVPTALNGDLGPSYWNEDWEHDRNSSHTKLRPSSWHPGNDIDVHLEYYPGTEKLFGGTIHLRFDIEFRGTEWNATDGRRPQQVFADELLSELNVDSLPDSAKIIEEKTSGIHKLLNIKYEFTMASDEDYLEALQGALEDMTPLVTVVNDVIGRWDSIAEEIKAIK